MRYLLFCAVALFCVDFRASAQFIPRAQDKPPGPALSPQDAIAKMKVPAGFTVELVASEPDIVNPVAMTFDEKGRVWVTESLEYPRQSAGKGRDRVKILEDTDGDGKADKFTVFADGLNIPSGIAVGHGGVWVANSPDILFLQDTDGDGKADKSEVVVTGFGRDDTHELPNSLTWGPDGWLYGWNGVFNPAHVKYRGKSYDFTCAIFRIHPKTREFEVWCEGTSNPWGIAFNEVGDAFSSACVIDHFWHLTESGYYHRQGGPYPPFTWKLESIVDFKHQKAAYCGVHFYDSDAYPEAYRKKFYMGNIHGNAINVDSVVKSGATYKATKQEDFLAANDAWFMPVVQKTGPDGSLYILDWYDQYHCYQDANRDPAGVDRLKGRLYRIRYKDTPRRANFDLGKESDEKLIALLESANGFDRDIASRVLAERGPAVHDKLSKVVADLKAPSRLRLHALWALMSGGPVDDALLVKLMGDRDFALRSWAVRAAGNQGKVSEDVRFFLVFLTGDPDPSVLLQLAIAARKIDGIDPMILLVQVLSRAGEDVLTPPIVWQNLQPLLGDQVEAFLKASEMTADPDAVAKIYPRVIERLLVNEPFDAKPVAVLLDRLVAETHEAGRRGLTAETLALLAAKVQSGEVAGKKSESLRDAVGPTLSKIVARHRGAPEKLGMPAITVNAAILLAMWKDPVGLEAVRNGVESPSWFEDYKLRGIAALIAAGDASALNVAGASLKHGAADYRGKILATLGRLDDPKVAEVVVNAYSALDPETKPKAIELLTQRASWSKALAEAIAAKTIPASVVNSNQIRKLQATKDPELAKLMKSTFGTVRETRDPGREQVIARMRSQIRVTPGDPVLGKLAFAKVCGQCHKIYGEGQEVGPDLTSNGRNDYTQLLSNVFDPSLVIGAAYQATTLATTDGRVLTGLLAEDSPQRIVLKTQGGKVEAIARKDVEEIKLSPLSLMPEEIEKQLTTQEWADLFAFLTLDKPPGDASAKQLPGIRDLPPRETSDAAQFPAIVNEFAPGFATRASGEGGVAILKEHRGRSGVLRTHPVSQDQPCVITGKIDVPAGKTTKLLLEVSHGPGDWQLIVKANGKILKELLVEPKLTGDDGWAEVVVDLTPFAGGSVELELENRANNWAWEFGYWGRIAVISGR